MSEEITEQEAKEYLEGFYDLAIKMTPKLAKIYKSLYDNLKKEGFTEEQTLKIVCNYNMDKK